MRVALYARFSSDLQNERSADDQLAALRLALAARGWSEAGAYLDRGISGAAIANRPGLQTLLLDAAQGRFDLVMAEALDRISRDQEGTAHVFKRLTHQGVELDTLSEGRIGALHVGLVGTMNQLFLAELAKKTRRGLEARVRDGASGGGRCYGYDLGERGQLLPNLEQAAVVQRILTAYAAGTSPRAIAAQLNAEGVAGPRGGQWTAATINGDRRAQDGLLHNELYVGMRVWNRRRFRKDPDTGRRSSVLNPAQAWVRTPAPELRLVDDGLWARVRARQAALTDLPSPAMARRPKRLLSGLIRCGQCGGAMVLNRDRYACSAHRERGTCGNGRMIAAGKVEARVLDGLSERLLSPAAVAAGVAAKLEEQEADRRAALAASGPRDRELAELARKLDRATQAYLAGAMDLAAFTAATAPLKARQAALQAQAEAAAPPPPIQLHPTAPAAYRALAEDLKAALTGDEAQEARDIVRRLIERVDFHPAEGRGAYDLTVHGRLRELLNDKSPGGKAGADGAVLVGAGARSGRNLTITFAA